MNRKLVHEEYHSGIKLQKRIISSNNFTYSKTIELTDKYFANLGNILDIGCGVGTVDFFLGSKGKIVRGIDISKKAIQFAIANSKVLGLQNKTKFSVVDFPIELCVESMKVF